MDMSNISEWKKIALSFIAATAILRIIFFNESWTAVFETAAIIYWVFVLPGIGITYLFGDLQFFERFAASIPIGAVLMAVPTYYLGLLGVHVKYSAILLPIVFICVSAAIMFRESKKINKNTP